MITQSAARATVAGPGPKRIADAMWNVSPTEILALTDAKVTYSDLQTFDPGGRYGS
jgi:hypothetical protein